MKDISPLFLFGLFLIFFSLFSSFGNLLSPRYYVNNRQVSQQEFEEAVQPTNYDNLKFDWKIIGDEVKP